MFYEVEDDNGNVTGRFGYDTVREVVVESAKLSIWVWLRSLKAKHPFMQTIFIMWAIRAAEPYC